MSSSKEYYARESAIYEAVGRARFLRVKLEEGLACKTRTHEQVARLNAAYLDACGDLFRAVDKLKEAPWPFISASK